MNTGTASAQGKKAALYTSHHYSNKYVTSRFFFFSLVVQPINFQGSSLTKKLVMLINTEGSCMLTGVLWYIGARRWDGLCGAGSIWQRRGNTGGDIPWLHSLWCSEESVWCQGRLLSFTYTEEGDSKQKEFHIKNYRYYFYCWTGHCGLGGIVGCCARVMLSALEWALWQLDTAEWAASLVDVPEWEPRQLSTAEWALWQLGTAEWAASLVAVPEWCCLL